ncbi:MAG: 30S ribosome-binding factor RbfA [Gammaproteobacteria bacterium]|nr:30S ribosome-binding factor RbfA [Gammaproteobacteria bacterium]
MPSEFSRTERVAQAVRRELAPLLQRIAADRHLGLVSITAVEVTPDLRLAKVYVTRLGAGDDAELMRVLGEQGGRCRSQLARTLRLRYVPRLSFHHDDSLRRAARLAELLAHDRTEGARPDPAPDAGDET